MTTKTQTPTTTDSTCAGCARTFNGPRGLRAHQSQKNTTGACRPMKTPKATTPTGDVHIEGLIEATPELLDPLVDPSEVGPGVETLVDESVAGPVVDETPETQTPSEEISEETLARKMDTIQKLLRKAESTNFPAEAEALEEQAERMMVRYGIDRATLDMNRGDRGEEREEIVQVGVPFIGRHKNSMVSEYGAIVEAFRTTTVVMTTMKKGVSLPNTLHIIGAKSDVEAMVQMVESLQAQMKIATGFWWKELPSYPRILWSESQSHIQKREFMIGFTKGAARRVRSMVLDEVESDYAATTTPTSAGSSSTELVLVDRVTRAKEKAEELYPGITPEKSLRLTRGDREAFRAGVVAGHSAEVGQKRIDQ